MKKVFCAVKCALVLCLCLALLAGTACAEEMRVISTGESDYLGYGCTLPDGRLLLTGSKVVSGEYTAAWVLCLNPDRTVSWEAVEGEKGGWASADKAVLLPDGTIAVAFDNYVNGQDVVAVKTYTQDGQQTGKRFEVPAGFMPSEAKPSYLMLCRWDEEHNTDETLLVDWDGKELLRYDGWGMPGAYGWPVENTEELVLAGWDRTENGHGKIMKLDRQTGNVLWETTLDWQLPDTMDAWMRPGIKTEDGGYMALLIERRLDPETPPDEWGSFLAKFDAEGRAQRINGESFARDHLSPYRVFAYAGKIGAVCAPEQSTGRDGFRPLVFSWFDEDGTDLGATEVTLNLDDFPAVRQYLDWEPDEMNPEPEVSVDGLIPDGLWALARCYVSTTDSEGIPGSIMNSSTIVLIRIPELGE